jgi:outer membrane receptor protein involved in Fe transport
MRSFFILLCLFMSTIVLAQGTIRGKVTDENGEPVIGARLSLKDVPSIGTKTDLDGNYSLLINTADEKTLVVTYLGMDTILHRIQLKGDEVLVKDFSLMAYKLRDITEVKVVAKQVKANDYYMEKLKINSATTIDYISSETMKKTGDANVTAAVARVSGVSTSGGLITVRGIGDRYVKTTLNGSRIPTLDPLTNNIKLDIFPTSLVDNIIITKTASPDLPGDWTGAYLSVETKDYPDKLMVNVESQFGYNVQSTFRDFVTSERSSTDWLGFDGGLRSRNDSQSTILAPTLQPTNYQEMVALGLGSYFSGMGITGWTDGSPEESTYLRLGLIQLGLLNPTQMNDPIAYQTALNNYNTNYAPKAFKIINPEGTNYSNGFANNWNVKYRRAPLNFTQNFSIGDQVKLFGKPLGYIVGFRYGNTIRYDANGVSQRIGAEEVNYPIEFIDDARISRETNSWSMLTNLAYKINDYNKVSVLFMPNYIGTNDVANFSTQPDTNEFQEYRVRKNIFYEQRKQLIYQLASQHLLPKSNFKIESNTSYTRGSSVAPDFKLTQYDATRIGDSIVGYQFSPNAGDGIRRYYRYLRENLLDTRLSVEIPLIKPEKKLIRKLKFGSAYQAMFRTTKQDEYFLAQGNKVALDGLQNDDIDMYLTPDKFTISNGQIDFYYQDQIWDWNRTIGNSTVLSGYGLVDYEVFKRLRFNGGLRVEKAGLLSDIFIYDLLGYGINDGRRVNIPGYPLINPGIIDQVDLLPSGSLIFKLGNENKATTNLRLNFSQTVARPNIREMSASAVYDNEFRTLIYGNPNLKVTEISNFDFRFESYFKNNDNISFSVFYKDFTNHIEMGFGSSGITWDNNENSYVAGIELEGKKQFGKFLEFRTNVTFVKSYSQYVRKDFIILPGNQIEYIPIDTVQRTMFGQAPYIINGILSYKSDSLGLTATVSYNVQGPRLVITGILKGRPDIYEMPRHSLDFKITKSLGKYFSSSLTVRDILNAPVLRAYKLNDGYADFDRFRFGTVFTLGVAYKL